MIPSIASRLDILADIADQMEQNEENQQKLFLKYLIASIQKQQDKPIDFSTKITEQSSLAIQNKHNKFTHPFVSYSSSNVDFLKQVQDPISTNSIPLKKRYRSDTSSPDINQNDAYSERRKKNNEAAKRSRDTRRAKEDEIAIRATWLEQENVKLRFENAHLKQENVQLRFQIYSSTQSS